MQAGNVHYRRSVDLPETIAIFPLTGALLLPGGQLPLNIFEPRYLEMFDDALSGDRLIGIIQPRLDHAGKTEKRAVDSLSGVGCMGRITSFSETGDGRYIVSLTGVCRFRLDDEMRTRKAYRSAHVTPFLNDLSDDSEAGSVDRRGLIESFKAYLEANELDADWDSVERASDSTLVNCLSMISPFGPAEKQALLEAPDLKSRAETLIAITEFALANDGDDVPSTIQ
ncbi:LON peptidase substrate-binding domain-containing protein [Pararhizobium mangrovi]|uniref:Peptidase S16 n=1 Tax=Pararhizobium mangrovi TaxID=2590452 RepID=A0A506U5A9_9HYPH|nr:LON peptidase substrate-binding domain-containing protein [Pararhizobium mangrovi]TPW27739.1 peptidase S16 [Pararhizobium mangrovi]